MPIEQKRWLNYKKDNIKFLSAFALSNVKQKLCNYPNKHLYITVSYNCKMY